jgi:pimeloyl-ACP methyl ester carboxylesterase
MVASALRASDPEMPARREWLRSADGLDLALDVYGPESAAQTIVFAHGFGQSRHAWSASAQVLGTRGYRCITADGRGHGDSGWRSDGAYAMGQFSDDANLLVRYAGSYPVWVGASMGGLLGILAEAQAPTGLLGALILVDITPRWEARGVERIMQFMRAHPGGFDSLEHAQATVANYLPHRTQPKSPERLAKLLVRGADGRLRWHWDPRLLDTVAHEATGFGERLEGAAQLLKVPVLLISGGLSDVVSTATISEFRRLVPHAEHVCIEDATHMVVGDSNARFTGAIENFLEPLASIGAPSSSGVWA